MRKIWLLRALFLPVIVMVFAPLVFKRDDGMRIMTVSDLVSFDMALIKSRYIMTMVEMRRALSRSPVNSDASRLPFPEELHEAVEQYPEGTIYKWLDKNGEWVFSDTRPQGLDVEVIRVEIRDNISPL